MSQSLSQVIFHLVFSTHDRFPWLRSEELRTELNSYIGGILSNLKCPLLAIGGTEDHVHILLALNRTESISDLVRDVKKGSSSWLRKKEGLSDFSWQAGFGIFSLGMSQVNAAKVYISGQMDHHKDVTFKEEFLTLLKRYQISYDERFLWD